MHEGRRVSSLNITHGIWALILFSFLFSTSLAIYISFQVEMSLVFLQVYIFCLQTVCLSHFIFKEFLDSHPHLIHLVHLCGSDLIYCFLSFYVGKKIKKIIYKYKLLAHSTLYKKKTLILNPTAPHLSFSSFFIFFFFSRHHTKTILHLHPGLRFVGR